MDYVITRTKEGETDELMHYGVLGMKWGKRKAGYDARSRGVNVVKSVLNSNNYIKKDGYHKNSKPMGTLSDGYQKHKRPGGVISVSNSQARANRAKSEAATARKLADKYVSAMDKKAVKRQAQADAKAAKAERKAKIKDTYKDIQKNATLKEKLIYNGATRKKAAKYVVNNNMTVEQAKKRANKDAIRNTAIFMGAYGAIAATSLYKMNH